MSAHESQPPIHPSGAAADPRPRPPAHRVNRRALAWWTCRALVQVFILLIVLGGTAVFVTAARQWLLSAMIVVAAIGAVYTLVMPQWRYRVHRWEIAAAAVYTQSGWFNQEWRVAPMSRIQTVDTVRGPLQRLFRLSNVTATTASAAGPLVIAGLDRDLAAELARELAETTQATPGDAT